MMVLIVCCVSLVVNLCVLGVLAYVASARGRAWLTRLFDGYIATYDDRVHRQSLAEARRLLDANREHSARLDAGGPAKIHKFRIPRISSK